MQYAERLHNSAGYPGPWQHDHGQYYLLVSAVAIASSTSTILGPVVTTQISMLHGTVSIPQPSFSHVPAVFYPQAPQQPDHPPHTQTQGMSRLRANSNATLDHLFYPTPSRQSSSEISEAAPAGSTSILEYMDQLLIQGLSVVHG